MSKRSFSAPAIDSNLHQYSTGRPDLAYHRGLQSASTRSTHLSASFKTCMDATIYPQTRHAPTTSSYIPGLKNLLDMYVCGIQQSKSVRLIKPRIVEYGHQFQADRIAVVLDAATHWRHCRGLVTQYFAILDTVQVFRQPNSGSSHQDISCQYCIAVSS